MTDSLRHPHPQCLGRRALIVGHEDELELSLAAIDLLAWTRALLLDGDLATAEPKKLRYRLLHVAARLTRGGRRLRLRISQTWPWRNELATAFHRLAALPRPVS
jgi:hypothetical protein